MRVARNEAIGPLRNYNPRNVLGAIIPDFSVRVGNFRKKSKCQFPSVHCRSDDLAPSEWDAESMAIGVNAFYGCFIDRIMPQTLPSAILLFAHGSSLKAWREPLDLLVDRLSARHPDIPCAIGFLERNAPDFFGALENLLGKVNPHFRQQHDLVASIKVIPIFLSQSVHTTRDLPQLIGNALDRYPNLDFEIAPTLLEQNAFTDFFEERISALISNGSIQ